METGHTLAMCDGREAEVIDISVQHADEGEIFTTYNVEVADTHTYFVGIGGLWVHNSGRLMCELIDTLYERYRKNGYSDTQARDKIRKLLDRRVKSGRITQQDADKHLKDASRAFRPDGVFESELSYAKRILGRNPEKTTFDVPGGADRNIGPKKPPVRAFGAREYDDYDKATKIGYELNQSPWSTMPLDQLRDKIAFKAEQLNKDVVLTHLSNGKVKEVRWIMTEKLPTTGERGRIVARLRDALDEACARWPDKFTIEIRK